MKAQIKVGALFLCLAVFIGLTSEICAARDDNQLDTALQRATDTIEHMTSAAPDRAVPRDVLESAKCVAVIPHLIKGAFIVGGEHGVGVATCKTGAGAWSAPAPFSVSGISWGPQIGGESNDIVMMMNDEGMRGLLGGHVKVGADVSAAAGPVGRQASVDAGWKAGILTYSGSKGAFIGASLSGAELHEDGKLTRELYGSDISFKDILEGNAHTPNSEAQAFVTAVENAKQSAMAH